MNHSNLPVWRGGRSNETLRFDELRNIENSGVDVLFIGSSHCLRTFDPRFFTDLGIRAFNLGTSGQTPINTYYLICRYLPKLKPKLVVLEVYWAKLSTNGVEGSVVLTKNYGPNLDTLRMALATRHPLALNAELAWRLGWPTHKRSEILRQPGRNYLQPQEEYTRGGFIERWDTNTQKKGDIRGVLLDDRQLDYLSSTLQILHQQNVTALLVWAPVPSSTLASVTNIDDVRRRMRDFADEHDVQFLDLNDGVRLDEQLDFYDDNHLNQRGVNKLMPALIDRLSPSLPIPP